MRREKINQKKIERKGKIRYAKKIKAHLPSGWCLHSTFAYGDVLDPVKMYRGKNCEEKFLEYTEDEIK